MPATSDDDGCRRAGISCLDVAAADRDLAAPRGLELDTRQDVAAAAAVDILSLERAATVEVAIVSPK